MTTHAHTTSSTTGAPAGIAASKQGARVSEDRSDALHALVMQHLDDDQAQDIVTIDLEGKSSMADHMVVATGRSTRQVASIAQKLAETLKADGYGPVRLEGLPAADWVVLDAGDVVVHLFRPEVRSFYNIERMWSFGDDDKKTAGGTA